MTESESCTTLLLQGKNNINNHETTVFKQNQSEIYLPKNKILYPKGIASASFTKSLNTNLPIVYKLYKNIKETERLPKFLRIQDSPNTKTTQGYI